MSGKKERGSLISFIYNWGKDENNKALGLE